MNTKTKQEVIEIVSNVLCVVAICVFSYFSIDKIQEAGKDYLNSMCEHRHVRMCILNN